LGPIFDDATVYQLDAEMFGLTSDSPVLPPPRSAVESIWQTDYRVRFHNWPTILGWYQLRNARGSVSFPTESLFFDVNTYDNTFGFAINPAFKLGSATIYLNPGLQFTIRRDKNVPVEVDQNLFRQQLYLSTSALYNWVTIRGFAIHEAGPYTLRDVTSSDYAAKVEFVVGRPWGKNALVTGYYARDLQLDPIIREYFTTSTYAGYQRMFGKNFKATFLGEYVRSWRVQDQQFAIAQMMRPAIAVQYQHNRWGVEGAFAFSHGQGFHAYDNVQTGFLISYTKPLRHIGRDGVGDVGVEFPLKFSVGIRQQSFFDFPGTQRSNFVPVINVSLF
jgi:hypothetical protein